MHTGETWLSARRQKAQTLNGSSFSLFGVFGLFVYIALFVCLYCLFVCLFVYIVCLFVREDYRQEAKKHRLSTDQLAHPHNFVCLFVCLEDSIIGKAPKSTDSQRIILVLFLLQHKKQGAKKHRLSTEHSGYPHIFLTPMTAKNHKIFSKQSSLYLY